MTMPPAWPEGLNLRAIILQLKKAITHLKQAPQLS